MNLLSDSDDEMWNSHFENLLFYGDGVAVALAGHLHVRLPWILE
jgi:hypothetical protein